MLEANANKYEVGRTALFNDEMIDCLYQNHLFRIGVDISKILPAFAMTYLTNPPVRAKLVPNTTAGLNSINKTQLKSLMMYYPPISIQEKFVNMVNIYEAIKRKQENSEDIVSKLVETLIHKLFKARSLDKQQNEHKSLISISNQQNSENL